MSSSDFGNASPCAFKRPESVLVLVCSVDGWVLLLERTQPAGSWQSVTGSLHWGEGARHAAQRELLEETGIQAGGCLQALGQRRRFRILEPWKARYAPGSRFNTEHWFALMLPSRRSVILQRDEHVRWRWVRPAQASRQVFSWTNREAIQTYCC